MPWPLDVEEPPEVVEVPTEAEVREWIDVSEADLSESMLRRIYRAEVGLQRSYCVVEPYTDWLAMALLRRCARSAAAKGLPLGTLPVQMTGYPDAYGAMIIPRLDAEIERYEGSTRIIAFG